MFNLKKKQLKEYNVFFLSTGGNREERIASQSYLNRKFIDGIFMIQPMTPDLRELFPTISDRYLKRNSSAVWNTPPRYSTMDLPKY